MKQSDLINVTDSQLDSMYANNFDAGYADTNIIGFEIVDRLSNVSSFIQGLIGVNRFPLYNARGRFKQSDTAQTSVKDSAKNVADTIAGFSLGVFGPVAAAGIVILIIYFVIMKRK